jgi:hypothetical protein
VVNGGFVVVAMKLKLPVTGFVVDDELQTSMKPYCALAGDGRRTYVRRVICNIPRFLPARTIVGKEGTVFLL